MLLQQRSQSIDKGRMPLHIACRPALQISVIAFIWNSQTSLLFPVFSKIFYTWREREKKIYACPWTLNTDKSSSANIEIPKIRERWSFCFYFCDLGPPLLLYSVLSGILINSGTLWIVYAGSGGGGGRGGAAVLNLITYFVATIPHLDRIR